MKSPAPPVEPDKFSEFVSDLVGFISDFEGIQERHRAFLLGWIQGKAAELNRPVDVERIALVAALEKSTRTARAANMTDKARRMMIRDTLAPYLRDKK